MARHRKYVTVSDYTPAHRIDTKLCPEHSKGRQCVLEPHHSGPHYRRDAIFPTLVKFGLYRAA